MMDKNNHVLIIGYVWPEPKSSAAGSRMMQLISLFQSQDWEVTFASAAAETEYMIYFEELGIKKVNIEINSSDFDDFVSQLQPSIVMFDRYVTEEQFGWRVAEQCPDALRILDTEDLHCLRNARQQAVKEGREFEQKDLLQNDIAKREIASIFRSDLSLIISEAEMKLLEDFFDMDKALLQYLPFLLEGITDSDVKSWPGFESREHFVTIGNFRHEPNWDAVLFLKKEIWPLIRKQLPQAELHIYGAYPTQKVNDLHKPEEGFYIKGRAEDAKEVVRNARVGLAPLRFGAGLKGKLVEAMQCGTPTVTTDIGAEGLNGDLEWSGIIANRPAKIAEVAVHLYIDKSRWRQAQQNGIQIINDRFVDDHCAAEFVDRIANLKEDLQSHRRNNFTGSMLMHHRAASSKYMSKWIEEKSNS